MKGLGDLEVIDFRVLKWFKGGMWGAGIIGVKVLQGFRDCSPWGVVEEVGRNIMASGYVVNPKS